MNRTDVTVDVDLLEEALKVTGEPSSDAVVDKALAELLRIARLKRGIQALRDTDDVFWPGYLEEIRPNAAQIYRRCREDGYTLASSFDCLIAACAIFHRIPLLQKDRDFEKIAEIGPLELLRNV